MNTLGIPILTLLCLSHFVISCRVVVNNSTCPSTNCLLDPAASAVVVLSNNSVYRISNCNTTAVLFRSPLSDGPICSNGDRPIVIQNVSIYVVGPAGTSCLPTIQLSNQCGPMYWSNMRIVLTHVSIVSGGATSLLWTGPIFIKVHLTNISIVLDGVNGSLLAQETSSVGAYFLYSSSGFLTVTNMSIMVQNSNLSISNFPLVGLLDGLSSISLTDVNVTLNSSTVRYSSNAGRVVLARTSSSQYGLFILSPQTSAVLNISNVVITVSSTQLSLTINTTFQALVNDQSFVFITLSVAYLCFVEGIVSRVSFIARNSSFVIAQEQLPSSLMIVNASVDTQLLHLEFAPMTISVSHLAVSIEGCQVNMSASATAQLLNVRSQSQDFRSLIDSCTIVVDDVTIVASVGGVLPLAVSARRCSVAAFEQGSSLKGSIFLIKRVRSDVSLEIGDDSRYHGPASTSRAQLVYFFQSSLENSWISVDFCNLQLSTPANNHVTAPPSLCAISIELVTVLFVRLSTCRIDIGNAMQNSSVSVALEPISTGYSYTNVFAQLAIMTAFGGSINSTITIRENVSLRVSDFRVTTTVVVSSVSSIVVLVQCFVPSIIVEYYRKLSNVSTKSPWSSSRIQVSNNVAISVYAGSVSLPSALTAAIISVPSIMTNGTAMVLNLSSDQQTSCGRRDDATTLLKFVPAIPIFAYENVTLSLNALIAIFGDVGCAPFLISSPLPYGLLLTTGSTIVVGVSITLVNESSASVPQLFNALYLFGCKLAFVDRTSFIRFISTNVTSIGALTTPKPTKLLYIAYDRWVSTTTSDFPVSSFLFATQTSTRGEGKGCSALVWEFVDHWSLSIELLSKLENVRPTLLCAQSLLVQRRSRFHTSHQSPPL
ncbi:membrane-associated protein, putative [Bodo saltans]|uniref:Membrane-associated protein, putative n=1 Tax=Bodo saltans TaxID=75058 RepID=A0A0S4J385_BODSA|nr:membrane-associated protein, putative [Bodo saltans]|eukprot:CUG85791.1 membrane-associated protein, putative [Bodo saltans]